MSRLAFRDLTFPRLGRRSGGGGAPVPITTAPLSTATHMGVDLALGATYEVGTYSDGMGVFIVAPGGITATGQTPAYTVSPRAMNGAMKNPTGAQQAFDANMDTTQYSATPLATYPLAMAAKDALVVCKSRLAAGGEDRDGVAENYGVFFVVDTVPAVGTLTPPAYWPTPATRPMALVANVDAIYAASPRRSASGLGITAWATAKTFIQRPAPMYAMMRDTSAGGYQSSMPFNFGDHGTNENYGAGINETLDQAILGAILTDAYSAADAKEAIYTLLGHGVQWAWGIYGNTVTVPQDGGHNGWQQACMMLAAHHLSDTTIRDYVGSAGRGNFRNGVRATAQLMNDVWNPHTSGGKNVIGRIRTAGAATSALVIEVPDFTEDPGNWQATNLRARRRSDGASAIITSTDNMPSGPDAQLAYTGTTFAPGDQFSFEPQWTLDIGDSIWTWNASVQGFVGSAEGSYIGAQEWTITLAMMVALNISVPGFDNALRYMIRANASNDPAGFDFPSTHSDTQVINWWASHGATTFAGLPAATDTTAPTASAFSAVQTSSTTAMIDVTTNEASGGLFYVLTNSATAPTPLQIRQRQDHTGAAAVKFGSRDVAATGSVKLPISGLSPSTLYHCHTVLTDMEKNSSAVQSTSFTTAATGTVFFETWDGLAVGNTYTEVSGHNGGYTRSNTLCQSNAVANANAPNGIGVIHTAVSSAHRWLFHAPAGSALAGLTTRRQFRGRLNLYAITNARAGLGYTPASGQMTGIKFGRGSGNWGFDLVYLGDPNSGPTGALFSAGATDRVEFLYEVNGDTHRAKVWLAGTAEPGTWSATATPIPGTNIAFDHAGFIWRAVTSNHEIEQWSVGIDVDAPALL